MLLLLMLFLAYAFQLNVIAKETNADIAENERAPQDESNRIRTVVMHIKKFRNRFQLDTQIIRFRLTV